MGSWDYFNNEYKCARCAHLFIVPERVKFGHIVGSEYYKIGDTLNTKLSWTSSQARDSLLMYFQGKGGCGVQTCSECGGDAVGIEFFSVESFVITGGLKPCPPSAESLKILKGILQWPKLFTDKDMLLLVEEHGCEKVAKSLYDAGANEFGPDWAEGHAELYKRIAAAGEAWMDSHGGKIDGINTSPDSVRLRDEEEQRFPASKWTPIRDGLLNRLWEKEQQQFAENFLIVDTNCPSCATKAPARIPFRYGPCGARGYAVGQKIDWQAPGRITDVRDPRVKYVRVAVPPCLKCGFEAIGYATVRKDVITDFSSIPADLTKEVRDWNKDFTVGHWEQPPDLIVFLGVREYGQRSVQQALASLPNDPALPALRRNRFFSLPSALHKLSVTTT